MMPIPVIAGVIRRRMLVNYRVDPDVAQRALPKQFRPKLAHGYAVAGICLIRLEQIRPKSMPALIGLSSENAAHRFSVEWDEGSETHEGVFIPRRDTSSMANHLVGGRLFSGEHGLAEFKVTDDEHNIDFEMHAADGMSVRLKAHETDALPSTSIFKTLEESSQFFENGAVGYSARRDSEEIDGLRLEVQKWKVLPLAIEEVYSSYYSDPSLFPEGSVVFDHALIMRNIDHEWHALPK